MCRVILRRGFVRFRRIVAFCAVVIVKQLDDGSEIVKRWTDRSRAESWTPEMKEKARQWALQARRKKK